MFKKKSVTVSSHFVMCPNGCEAMVDSGTTLISGPLLEIKQLNAMLGFDSDNMISCSSIHTLPSKKNFYVLISTCKM